MTTVRYDHGNGGHTPDVLEEDLVNGTTAFTGTAAADVIATQGAGVKIAVMGISVTNADATVSTVVTIRDGTTAKLVGNVAAVGTGPWVIPAGSVPLFVTAANAAVTAICGTTSAEVNVTVFGHTISVSS